jgi:hypothetical protein
VAIDKVVSASITDSSVTDAKLSFNSNQFRNIIINGDMSVAQRATSQASITSSGYYTCDRWQTSIGSMGTWTQSQSTDVPTGQGFAKSLKMDCTTANASPSSGNSLVLATNFEGQNLQYLKKGTSSAESTTLSFWVKSNKTGTYIAELMDNDNSNRHINNSYTISSADTWEKKTITFAGDTTGALDNDNANSFTISFWLGGGSNYTSGTLQTSWGSLTQANRAVGQVNLADSTSNEWYITGVQLETGTASDFEFLPVDVNLARCQRYFEKMLPETMIMLRYSGSTSFGRAGNYKVTKRASPSLSRENGTTTIGAYNGEGGAGSSTASAWAANSVDAEGFSISATTPTSPDQFFIGLGSDHFLSDSEL